MWRIWIRLGSLCAVKRYFPVREWGLYAGSPERAALSEALFPTITLYSFQFLDPLHQPRPVAFCQRLGIYRLRIDPLFLRQSFR